MDCHADIVLLSNKETSMFRAAKLAMHRSATFGHVFATTAIALLVEGRKKANVWADYGY
jgi:hypothetical protein